LAALCPWAETVVHNFQGGRNDGSDPGGDLAVDSIGNIYGTTLGGGPGSCGDSGCGSVYELTPAGGGWNKSVLYSFTGGSDGDGPYGVVIDGTGNLYGSTGDGWDLNPCGHVFQLSHSDSGWIETTVHAFTTDEGCVPGGLIFDPAGNLYGMTGARGSGGGGNVFQLAHTGSDWNLNVLYALAGEGDPLNSLARDANGNLYGVLRVGGLYGYGAVFKLSPTLSGWNFTDLHDFNVGGDGVYPFGAVVLDAQGNLYGTTAFVVWEITP